MVRITNVNFNNFEVIKPKTAVAAQNKEVQTFQNGEKNDYTQIVRNNRYAAHLITLNTKFENINAEEYIDAARFNGDKLLCISDEDFENYGKKWDACVS